MTTRDLVWLLGFATFPLFGLVIWRLDVVRRMDLPGRIATAFAAGIVFVTTLMWAFALMGVTWTRVTLGIPLVFLLVAGGREVAKSRKTPATPPRPRDPAPVGVALLLALTAYGIFTARETCADLLYFWGPKAQRFWMTGTIDVGFLSFPHYYLMHPDYPPLLPEAFAFASNFAHRFAWWGALGTMLLFLAASAAVLRAFVGGRKGGWYALLLTAVLGYGYSIGMVAGAADPLLIFFELVALCAVTFGGEGENYLAAIALTGVVMTKVEGMVFAVVLVVAMLLLRRGVLKILATVAPAAILLATWIAFCWKHGLLDSYAKAKQQADWSLTGLVIKKTIEMASYQAFYLPWLAPLATLSLGRQWKRAALPLLVTAGSLAYIIFFYLHIDARLGDPAWWVASSAERVLLTPLMSLVVAAAAASE